VLTSQRCPTLVLWKGGSLWLKIYNYDYVRMDGPHECPQMSPRSLICRDRSIVTSMNGRSSGYNTVR